MGNKKEINLNLDPIVRIAETGVKRASLFMGMGLNAVRDPNFRDYQLHKIPKIEKHTSLPFEMLPAEASSEQVEHFKSEFEIWIVGNGFRELLEHYALSLDKVHEVVLFVLLSKRKITETQATKDHETFRRRLGVPDKMNTLKKRFSIALSNSDNVESLYAARNCLTHDLGIVSSSRYNSREGLALSWRAFDLFAQGDVSGQKIPILDLIGNVTTEEMSVFGQVVSRQKRFSANERLMLSRQDLWEICFFFKMFVIPSTMQGFIAFLEAHNVPLHRT